MEPKYGSKLKAMRPFLNRVLPEYTVFISMQIDDANSTSTERICVKDLLLEDMDPVYSLPI